MKKIILSAVLTALVAFNAVALDGLKIGPRVGMNVDVQGWATGDESVTLDAKVGFHLGGVVDVPLGEYFAFQPGLMFTTRGAKNALLMGDQLNLYYFELPLQFSLRVPFGDGWFKWNIITAGPSVGIGLVGKYKYGGESEDAFDGFAKRFDAGLTFGTAFEFGNFYLGGRYYIGLVNILEDADDIVAINGSSMFTLGWNFEL